MARPVKTATILISGAALLLLTHCKKTVVVIPEPCLSASSTQVSLNDTIIFNNCTIADDSYLFIYRADSINVNPEVHYSEPGSTHVYKCIQTGTFIANVQGLTNMAPIKNYKLTFVVTE